MTDKRRRRGTEIVEKIKGILLGVLVVSLVALVAVYVTGSNVYETMANSNASGESFNMLWSVQGGSEPEGLDGARLLPELVGYKQSSLSSMRAGIGDTDVVSELYGLVKPCLTEVFGSDYVCGILTDAEGEAAFAAARSGDEFVYLRYHTPVLYQLIYAYAADSLIVSESDVASGTDGSVGAYIYELMIVPDTELAAHRFVAYARDGSGNFYEFRPSEHVVSSSFYISKLASGASGITTYELEFFEHPQLEFPQPLIDGELVGDIISVEQASLGELDDMAPLLRLFGYNPDKLDGYTDGDASVYIDAHSRLYIDSETLRFITEDAGGSASRGIDIESLLGYTVDGMPTLFNKLTAVDNLIGKLEKISPQLTGGKAALCLGDVYSDGALLVIEYFLTYNNIRIGGEPYLRAVLTDSTVCEVTLSLDTVSDVMDTELILNPRYVLTKLIEIGDIPADKNVRSFGIMYNGSVPCWTADLGASEKE